MAMAAVDQDKISAKTDETPIVNTERQDIVVLFLQIHAAKQRAERNAQEVRIQSQNIRAMLDKLGVLTR
jgi:hypothetical protein